MDANKVVARNEISSNLLEGVPLKSYKKTILGQLLLKIWDSMTGREGEIIFSGDPRKAGESVFHVYSDHERAYFERANRTHFDKGMLIPYEMPQQVEASVVPFEQYTDDDLKTIVNSKFLSLTSTLGKIESLAVLFRIKTIAEELEKSNKIIKAIDARVSQVQAGEYDIKNLVIEDSDA